MVAVFISGRPLWMNREINAADAFVAAWLPGSEGAGVADVLLRKADGSVNHDFKGKLSFSWPRNAVDAAVNKPGHEAQFAFGYGLTYADKGDLAPLPEESGIDGLQAPAGVYFARGQLAPGLSLQLEGAQGAAATKVTTVPVALADNSLTISAVDHERQEDARRLTWSGKQAAGAAILAEPAQELTRETNGDLLLVLTLRADVVPATGSITASAGAGKPLPLRDALAALPAGKWTTLGIPLKCFVAAGADPAKLDTLLRLHSDAAATLSISRVAVGAVSEAEHILSCPQ